MALEFDGQLQPILGGGDLALQLIRLKDIDLSDADEATTPADTDLLAIDHPHGGVSSGNQSVTNKITAGNLKTYFQSGLAKADVGLGNVDNTSDADKPVSTATQTALDAKLNLSGGTMTGDITLPTDGKIVFDDADEYIKGDGSKLIISSTGFVDFNASRLIGAGRFQFNDGGSTVDIIRDEDNMSSDDDAALATQQSIKAYVDTNKRWHQHTGGYKLNNSSDVTYYFQYRFGDHNWSNSDSSPTTITVYDSYASVFIAPYAGELNKISVHGYASDTGATDPFKFYVFKGTPAAPNTNLSLTQIGITDEVTPAAARQFSVHTSISSSNTFARNDSLFVMYKKESSSASQDLYFSVTISGVYTE
jgi:hypothetical protein